MVGKELNHYRILRELGRGGMGAVYAAEDSKLHRQVAIKVLPEEVADDDERLRRFQREARAVAALNHPNIVVVHSVEESAGAHFITMELVEGGPLADVIPAGGLPLEKFFDYGVALADAVSAAHESGITHRDLKPTNVMVTPDERIKVLDFGLAKLAEPELSDDDETQLQTASLTSDGKIVGTAAFMSPEQAEGKPVDHRADIFALGILLFQMATGDRPFKGESTISLLSSIMKDPAPSATDLKPGLPRHLARVISRCLEKNPEHRYQSAKDVRNELNGLRQEVASGYSSASAVESLESDSAGGKGRVLGLVAAGVVVLAGLVYFLRGSGTDPAPVAMAPQLLSIATADSTSGVYYPLGRGMANVLEREVEGLQMEVLATDGSFENALLVDSGEATLALIQSDVAFHSVHTDRVLGHRSERMVGLMALSQEQFHVLVRNDRGVTSLDDFRGREVNLNLPESGSRFTTEMVLSHFGIGVEEMKASFLSTLESNVALLDGTIAVSTQWVSAPGPDMMPVFRSGDVGLLSIPPDLIAGLRTAQPFLTPGRIPRGTYPNQEQDIDTVAVKSLLVASADLPDQLVTQMLDALFANIPDLIAAHPRAAEISFDRSFRLEDGMSIPLHPAAEAYWRSHAP
jgi:TRAP transporter TAXI family solute receptor